MIQAQKQQLLLPIDGFFCQLHLSFLSWVLLLLVLL
jgi:hypothetical protein